MGWRTIKKEECPHLSEIKSTTTNKSKCEVCREKTELRLCTSCGYVACCESHLAHNTEHYKKTNHAIIKRIAKEQDWLWCYKCDAFLK